MVGSGGLDCQTERSAGSGPLALCRSPAQKFPPNIPGGPWYCETSVAREVARKFHAHGRGAGLGITAFTSSAPLVNLRLQPDPVSHPQGNRRCVRRHPSLIRLERAAPVIVGGLLTDIVDLFTCLRRSPLPYLIGGSAARQFHSVEPPIEVPVGAVGREQSFKLNAVRRAWGCLQQPTGSAHKGTLRPPRSWLPHACPCVGTGPPLFPLAGPRHGDPLAEVSVNLPVTPTHWEMPSLLFLRN